MLDAVVVLTRSAAEEVSGSDVIAKFMFQIPNSIPLFRIIFQISSLDHLGPAWTYTWPWLSKATTQESHIYMN